MAQPNVKRLLDYLPAIFREEPTLGHLLIPFEEVLDGFRTLLDGIDRYVVPLDDDPQGEAPSEFLPWLAGWMALTIDEEWDESKVRNCLAEAVELYRRRGTVDGLGRFLEIYTGRRPGIRECLWPAGMQIGVASRIGGMVPPVSFSSFAAVKEPEVFRDYYVVRELAPGGAVHYYRADQVRKVEVEQATRTVTLHYLPPEGYGVAVRVHGNAAVTRRDALPETRYTLTGRLAGSDVEATAEFVGDTALIESEEKPYRFIVELPQPPTEGERKRAERKVRAIVDLEKPAHTLYYLRMVRQPERERLDAMQIDVRSTVGVDTTVG